METSSYLCSSCGLPSPLQFCLCDPSGILFCSACLPDHLTTNISSLHSAHSILAYPYRYLPGYFDRLQQRKAAVSIAGEELRNNIGNIDRCIEGLKRESENVINLIREYARNETEKLKKLKEEMQTDILQSLDEAEKTLYEDNPKLKTKYAGILRVCSYSTEKLNIFKYCLHINCQNPKKIIELRYALHDSSHEIPSDIIPQIHRNSIHLYDVKTGQTTSGTLSVTLSPNTVFCFIDANMVLCVGGHPASTQSHRVDIRKLTVIETQSMISARYQPGIIKSEEFIYVFGGYDNTSPMRQSEKFHICRRNWRQIPNMTHPRGFFSPCLYNKEIYLMECQQSHRTVEKFQILREEFIVLPIKTFVDGGNSVAFVINDEIMVITTGGLVQKWRIGKEKSLKVTYIGNSALAVSMMPPVRIGKSVFWVSHSEGKLVKYDVEKQKLTSE